MTPSGTDYFTRLITNLTASTEWQKATTKPSREGARRAASSQPVMALAEALMKLPPESKHRVAYNSVMDQAAVLNLGSAVEEVEQDHVEDYRLNYPASRDPNLFLANLIGDIDDLIDDAEISAGDEAFDRSAKEADFADARANEIAHGIACKKAEDGAREAAEEAYRLAYQWAYEDIFEEAYEQALSQLI